MRNVNPLDHRNPDGSCSFCGQAKITWRHECEGLRALDRSVGKKQNRRRSIADRLIGEDFTSRYKDAAED